MSVRSWVSGLLVRKAATATPRSRRAPASREVVVDVQRGMYTAFGYRSARVAERDGRTASAGAGRTHERWDRAKLQALSREFRRDNGIYGGMLGRARDFIVGKGFKLQCSTSDEEWNADVERRWRSWWRRPDVDGRSGLQVEQLLASELLVCGEVGAVLTDRGKLQLIEAEQIAGPARGEDGIFRGADGSPIGYHVAPYDANGSVALEKGRRYEADVFAYLGAAERPSSARAVPPCESVFSMLHRINDVCDSEAIAWQMQARIALSVTRASGLPIPSAVARDDDTKASGDEDGDLAGRWVTELDYALIFHGEPGDEVKGVERTAPSGTFSETLVTFLRLLGLPLGLPLELLLLDWTKSNYSQSRAVLEQAGRTFAGWQSMLEDLFYRRIYEWWLRREMAAGTIEAREDALEHEWIRPAFPWIDRLVEAQAHGEQVDRGFTTYDAVLKSQSLDREAVLVQLRREVVEAIELAQEIKEQTGVAVPWEPFAGRKVAPPTRAVLGALA